MANTKSASKRARQNIQRTMRNRRVLTQLRTFQKRTKAGVDKNNASAMISALDRAAKRGIIHKNAAKRRKARLNRALAAGAKAAK